MLLQELLPAPPTTTAEALEIFDASPAVEPGFMPATVELVTSLGALAPGTRTAPMTRSAALTASSRSSEDE